MYSLGFDIGGTKSAVILGSGTLPENPDSLVLDRIGFPTEPSRGWHAVISELFAMTDKILKRNAITKPSEQLIGIGISCGGPLDSKEGIIKSPPNLPDWHNVPIVEMTEKRYGVKAVLQNDANACAVAEWRFGAAKGLKNIVFLTFGTGMGAGLILDGKLYSGTNDMAGEVGHIRLAADGPEGYGKKGSFEGFCSGGGIARLAEQLTSQAEKAETATVLSSEKGLMTAKSVAIAAKRGDKVASQVYKKSAEKLGLGLSVLIDILNPEAIVIGSIYERDTALFKDTIEGVIEKEALSLSSGVCKILPSALGNSIGDFAALGLVFQ